MSLLSIIIPIFNEEDNIAPIYEEIRKVAPPLFELIWVDDGSLDDSFNKIIALSESDERVKCISLSRNFGHQAALVAGLRFAQGEKIIIMDGDFQHPPSLIPDFLEMLSQGYDIVSGKRTKTKNISWVKKITSKCYYRLINFLSDIHIEENTADFRAFNNKVLNSVLAFEEKEIFLRGIFSWVGFKKAIINYESPRRKFGHTKYSSSRMLGLGLKGVLSFSFKPLRLSLLVGTVISIISFFLAINAVVAYFKGDTVPGWASLMIAIMFFGGIQLLFLGLIGEYIASLFTEIKNRPMFIIDRKINMD